MLRETKEGNNLFSVDRSKWLPLCCSAQEKNKNDQKDQPKENNIFVFESNRRQRFDVDSNSLFSVASSVSSFPFILVHLSIAVFCCYVYSYLIINEPNGHSRPLWDETKSLEQSIIVAIATKVKTKCRFVHTKKKIVQCHNTLSSRSTISAPNRLLQPSTSVQE